MSWSVVFDGRKAATVDMKDTDKTEGFLSLCLRALNIPEKDVRLEEGTHDGKWICTYNVTTRASETTVSVLYKGRTMALTGTYRPEPAFPLSFCC